MRKIYYYGIIGLIIISFVSLIVLIWFVNQIITGQITFENIGIALVAVAPLFVVLWVNGKNRKNN